MHHRADRVGLHDGSLHRPIGNALDEALSAILNGDGHDTERNMRNKPRITGLSGTP